MAVVPGAVHLGRPGPQRPGPHPGAPVRAGRRGSATTCRAATSTPAPIYGARRVAAGRARARDPRHRAASARSLGILAGYAGGWVDALLSRFGEVFFGLPFVLGAIVILTTFNAAGRAAAARAGIMHGRRCRIAVLSWPVAMRIMRVGGDRREAAGLREGGPGARRRARRGSSSGTCCRTASPRCWSTRRSRSARSSAPRRRCRSSASACGPGGLLGRDDRRVAELRPGRAAHAAVPGRLPGRRPCSRS